MASVASDRNVIPSGTVLLVEVPDIDNNGNWMGTHKLHLMVALDVGGAVNGHHFDLYRGIGAVSYTHLMGGVAMIAKQMGYKVTGSDTNVYPPMSTFLQEQGIEIIPNYDVAQLQPVPDMVIVGNAMKRGNPCVEYVLDNALPYTSGPQWLHAVSYTHLYYGVLCT